LGRNTIEFSRGPGITSGNGFGWDTLLLEVDEETAPPPAALSAQIRAVDRDHHGRPNETVWTIEVTNTGTGPANDVRLTGFDPAGPGRHGKTPPAITSRDPHRLPVPVAASLPPGATTTTQVTVDFTDAPYFFESNMQISFSANGGRARTTVIGR
jgi:rhamnogalacturonan endolyase